ncbi:MAG: DUF2793 domain-containing protein [Pseudomonadaceae bacterium]|nr:DUF2793 domain-containing protein [Pseudomonadaceae bacterium]
MTSSINNAIEFVPQNTTDPASGLNLSINQIDMLLQCAVTSALANTPPTGVEGERHIVGPAPTGAWAGKANKLARYLNAAWTFADARIALSIADGRLYLRQATTWAAFGGPAGTGWTAGTGTENKAAYAADTATLLQTSQRVLALEKAIRLAGIIV